MLQSTQAFIDTYGSRFPQALWLDEGSVERLGVNQSPGGNDYPFVEDLRSAGTRFHALLICYSNEPLQSVQLVRTFRLDGLPVLNNAPAINYFSVREWSQQSQAFIEEVLTAGSKEAYSRVLDLEFEINGHANLLTSTLQQYFTSVRGDFRFHHWSTTDRRTFVTAIEQIRFGEDDKGVYQRQVEVLNLSVDPSCFVEAGNFSTINDEYERVMFNASNNVDITRTQEDVLGEQSSVISITARAGAGEGQLSQQSVPSGFVRTINGVSPDTVGNIFVKGFNCYKFSQEVDQWNTGPGGYSEVQFQPGLLSVENVCGPCCTCDQYVALYKALGKSHDKLESLTKRYNAVVKNITELVTVLPNEENYYPLQTIWKAVDAERINVSVAFCNIRNTCLNNVLLFLDFQFTDEDGTVWDSEAGQGYLIPSSVARRGNQPVVVIDAKDCPQASSDVPAYAVGGKWPHYWVHFDSVAASSLGTISFMMRWSNPSETGPIHLTADVYAADILNPMQSSDDSPLDGKPLGLPPVQGSYAEECRVVKSTLRTTMALQDKVVDPFDGRDDGKVPPGDQEQPSDSQKPSFDENDATRPEDRYQPFTGEVKGIVASIDGSTGLIIIGTFPGFFRRMSLTDPVSAGFAPNDFPKGYVAQDVGRVGWPDDWTVEQKRRREAFKVTAVSNPLMLGTNHVRVYYGVNYGMEDIGLFNILCYDTSENGVVPIQHHNPADPRIVSPQSINEDIVDLHAGTGYILVLTPTRIIKLIQGQVGDWREWSTQDICVLSSRGGKTRCISCDFPSRIIAVGGTFPDKIKFFDFNDLSPITMTGGDLLPNDVVTRVRFDPDGNLFALHGDNANSGSTTIYAGNDLRNRTLSILKDFYDVQGEKSLITIGKQSGIGRLPSDYAISTATWHYGGVGRIYNYEGYQVLPLTYPATGTANALYTDVIEFDVLDPETLETEHRIYDIAVVGSSREPFFSIISTQR